MLGLLSRTVYLMQPGQRECLMYIKAPNPSPLLTKQAASPEN